MKKGIIFDVDGVMVDVSQSYHYAIKHTAEHFTEREIPIEEVQRIKFSRGINNDWLATLEVIREFGKEVELQKVIEVFNGLYRRLRDKERLIIQRDFFESFREVGIPMGVVTGRPREDLLYLFERFDLFSYFECIVDEDTIEQRELRKPHPYALHLCVETLGIDKGVYVGDSLADWQMVQEYRKAYKKPMAYIHIGDRARPQGVCLTPPERLFEALQEVLRSL
ncbi:MAG: HAD family hydrolase [Aquificaceae bacterium]